MNDQQRAKNIAAATVMALLFIIAIIGIAGCFHFAQEFHEDRVSHGELPGVNYITADSGLNGGAIGCGIFGAAALYGFVKVFLSRI